VGSSATTATNQIDLTTIASASITTASLDAASDVLSVSATGSAPIAIQLSGTYAAGTFVDWILDPGGAGSDVFLGTVACFCRGTMILTEQGEIAVEDLKISDRVATASGEVRPIQWIGRRAYDPRFVAGNRNVLPIRIEAGALAHTVPARDLWVSPEHALYLRGVLVPAQLLVNDATITQSVSVERLEYFHTDLGTHDVILAEGTAAETYVDCDNRGMFHNAREFAQLYPGAMPPRWDFCARRIEEGAPELAAIRRGVLAGARLFGRYTDDPDLHLVVDGSAIRPQLIANRRLYRFTVPAGGRSVVIASRSVVPMKIERSSTDGRRLGVAIERILLRGTGLSVDIGHDCPALCRGFHAAEAGYRWTDGRGNLPARLLASFAGVCVMEVHLAETEFAYGLEAPATAASGSATSSRPPAATTGSGRKGKKPGTQMWSGLGTMAAHKPIS
jgi:hypothetical protein